MSITSLLFGRRLANREAEGRKIGALEGIPAMGLDGLGSASYGPEAMLTALVGAGAAGLSTVQPLTWAILGLLAVLFFSYWQTIAAYPSNGGAYTVARENLGRTAGLLGAAALMLDYLLNVAVGISAGVGALTSAVPSLQPYTLALCLVILVVLTLVNLRGTKESGLALAVPTYLFIASLFIVLGTGLAQIWTSGPAPVDAPPPLAAAQPIGWWLVLRAFAAGCTAMTGVEAVSNGVSAFRAPTVRYAHRTLAGIVAVLGLLLFGIAALAQAYGVGAMDQTQDGYQSVISQIVAAVVGRNWLYYVAIASVLAVLSLSANTSFVGFPRLCRQVASDGYLPKAFALPGRRLVYSVGVLFLASGAGGLLVLFGGITDRLIPLFAVGAFLSFTLSQAGMAVHWRTKGTRRSDHARLAINGLGAIVTGIALAVILAAKFTEGAWLTVIALPLTLLLLLVVHRYYKSLDRQVLEGDDRAMDLADHGAPVVVIPLLRWNRMAYDAVELGLRLSPDVLAVHVTDLDGPDAEEHDANLRREWSRFVERPAAAAGLPPPRLAIAPSPYRSLLAPVLRAVAAEQARCPGRPVMVAMPELVGGKWWEAILHTSRAKRLRGQILRNAGPGVSVLVIPWQLAPPETARVLAEEEPQVA